MIEFRPFRSIPARAGGVSASFRGVARQPSALLSLLRLTQARTGDLLDHGVRVRLEVLNAFTALDPDTGATVRAVDD